MQHRAEKIMLGAISAITWFALGLQFYLIVNNAVNTLGTPWSGVINFFSYFTILTNLLVGVTVTLLLFSKKPGLHTFFQRNNVRTAVCVYILIVGIVYFSVLRQVWNPQGGQLLADILLHYAIPVLYFIYWIIFVREDQFSARQITSWLAYPLLYLIYALCRGIYGHWFAYPFLNTDELEHGEIAVNCLVISLGFVMMSILLVGIRKGLAGIYGRNKMKS